MICFDGLWNPWVPHLIFPNCTWICEKLLAGSFLTLRWHILIVAKARSFMLIFNGEQHVRYTRFSFNLVLIIIRRLPSQLRPFARLKHLWQCASLFGRLLKERSPQRMHLKEWSLMGLVAVQCACKRKKRWSISLSIVVGHHLLAFISFLDGY